MRIFYELTHTGCDREIMRCGFEFDAFHVEGWNEKDRPKPGNARMIRERSEYAEKYDAAIVGTDHGLNIAPKGVPVIWKCLTDYGKWDRPDRILQQVAAWVAPCKETVDRWDMKDHPKARVIEHGIDSDVFSGYRGDGPREVLTVGNLLPIRPEKGPENITGLKLPIDILGFGNEKMAGEMVRVLGFSESMAALAEAYRSYHVYFNPCSVVVCAVLEAMATGMPVVTMRPGNFKDLMEHRGNCLVADTIEDARQLIGLLLKNPGLCRDLGHAARESVRYRLHPAVCSHEWKSLLRTIV